MAGKTKPESEPLALDMDGMKWRFGFEQYNAGQARGMS